MFKTSCKKQIFFFKVFTLYALVVGWANAQPISRFSSHILPEQLSNSIYFLEDSTNHWQLAEILTPVLQAKFQPCHQATPNFGITPHTVWLKINLQHQTNKELAMEIANPTLQELQLYVVNQEGKLLSSAHTGSLLPFKQRPIQTNFFVLPLRNIPENQPFTCYLKVKSNYPLQLPITISNLDSMVEKVYFQGFFHSAYFGFMFLALCFSLTMFFYVKETIYIYYFLYVFFNVLSVGGVKGYNAQFLWSAYPILNERIMIFLSLAALFVMFFSHSFLQITSKDKIYYRIGWMIGVGCLFTICLNLFIDVGLSVSATELLAIFIYLYLLVVSTDKTFIQKQPHAIYYFIGVNLYIVGIVLFLIVVNNGLPHNNFTSSFPEIGTAVEVLFFSFGLANKILVERNEKKQTTLQLVEALKTNEQIIREQNEMLEKKVAERTEELEQATNTLLDTHYELQLQMLKIQQQKEEILQQTEELQTTNQKLVEVSRYRQAMTNMIVHDLKNPLNLLLNLPKQDPTIQLNKVKQQGSQMLNQVLNILDLQKYATTEMLLELRPYNLAQVVDKALGEVDFLYEPKALQVIKNINPLHTVKADAEILHRIFVNILTNAIKYTPINGTITLSSENHSATEQPIANDVLTPATPLLKISIADTGQGIPADKKHLVFEPFGQVDAKHSGSVRSTGLGLSFCKMAVEAHYGSIALESEVGKGTTFWFTLLQVPQENASIFTQPIESQKRLQASITTIDAETQTLLQPYYEQFSHLMVYESSEVETLMESLPANNNPVFVDWKKAMQKAIEQMNEARYSELVALLKK